MTAKDILKDLVAINTIADKENKKFMDYADNFFTGKGFSTKRLVNGESGMEVLVAEYGTDAALGFLGHTDTVGIADGWETDPFTLTEKDGYLYGLGACDMKSGIAATMKAIDETDLSTLKRGLKVYLTYDEEVMFGGINDLINAGPDFAEKMIIAEPTNLTPVNGSKGLLEFILTFTGKATHSSQPIEGMNSNKNAVRFLNRMLDFEEELKAEREEFFNIPYTTMNIGIIEGGQAINIVPDKTTVYLDFRINDSKSQYDRIKSAVDRNLEGLNGSYVIINDKNSFREAGELSRILEERTGKAGIPFTGISEASFMEGDRIIFGAGPDSSHQANEHISNAMLEETVEIYKELIDKLCK